MQTCPRCGAPLPPETYLEAMKQAEGRGPAYRLRHRKANKRMCVAYVGPELPRPAPPASQPQPRTGTPPPQPTAYTFWHGGEVEEKKRGW